MTPSDNQPATTPPRRGRWVLRVLLLLVLLVALAPTVASFAPFRDWIVGAAVRDVNGTVAAGGASFGWLSGQRLDDIQVRSTDGQPLVTIHSLASDQSLWRLATAPDDLGVVRIEKPHAHLLVTREGSNFATAFPKLKQNDPETHGDDSSDRLRQAAVRVEVHDATISWRLAPSPQEWTVGGMNLSLAVEPASRSAEKRAMLVIEPSKLLDQCELTPDMCDGALKFIAPYVEGAPGGQGKVSLALDGGRLPLDDPKSGELAGALSFHTVQIESRAPLVRIFAALLQVPAEIELAHESVIKFKLTDGRVYHQNIDFGLSYVLVRTAGSVGLDESLDLVAEFKLRVPGALADNRPLIQALNERTIRLPITGTLKEPKLDTAGLGQHGLEALVATVKSIREGKAGAAEGFAKQLQDILRTNQAGPVSGPDYTGIALEGLEGLIKWQRERKAGKQQVPSPEQSPNEQQEKKRPLGRLLEKVIRPPE